MPSIRYFLFKVICAYSETRTEIDNYKLMSYDNDNACREALRLVNP